MTLDLARPLFWGPFPPQPYCDYVSPELHERQGELWNLTALLRVTEVQFERNHQAPSLVFNYIWCLNEASLQTWSIFPLRKSRQEKTLPSLMHLAKDSPQWLPCSWAAGARCRDLWAATWGIMWTDGTMGNEGDMHGDRWKAENKVPV